MTANVHGVQLFVTAPEDTILMKLSWARDSGSERQFNDALGVYELQGLALDRAYLDEWAESLGIADSWRKLQREAEPLE